MRDRLAAFVNHPLFDRVIIVLIALNAITLGLETSDWVMSRFGALLVAFDTLILAIFVAEIAARSPSNNLNLAA